MHHPDCHSADHSPTELHNHGLRKVIFSVRTIFSESNVVYKQTFIHLLHTVTGSGTTYLNTSLLKGPSGVDNRSPLHFLLGYGVNVAPAKMLTLHLSLQTPSPSLLWTPRSPPACWVPSECLSSDVTFLLPQCVSQPRPS